MKKALFIGVGGFLGAVLRYLIKGSYVNSPNFHIPIDTLIINITGSFLLALIFTITLRSSKFDANVRMGVTVGFFGAFTTFSTVCKEIVTLLQAGEHASAFWYAAFSVIVGLAAAWFGFLIGRIGTSRKIADESEAKE